MSPKDKPLVWMRGEIKTPPFYQKARLEAGYLLRQLQKGIIDVCKERIKRYDADTKEGGKNYG